MLVMGKNDVLILTILIKKGVLIVCVLQDLKLFISDSYRI